jgi:hypothetical protein
MKHVMGWVPFVVLLAGLSAAQDGEELLTLKPGPARELVATRCALCHSLDYIEMNAPVMTRARWEASLKKMVERFGAPLDAAEQASVVEYLSLSYADGK